jgi:hypothetical protein
MLKDSQKGVLDDVFGGRLITQDSAS